MIFVKVYIKMITCVRCFLLHDHFKMYVCKSKWHVINSILTPSLYSWNKVLLENFFACNFFIIFFIHFFTPCYYRVAKRQRIVDILLQIMVESVGFTVSKQFCPVIDGHCLCNCIFYLLQNSCHLLCWIY